VGLFFLLHCYFWVSDGDFMTLDLTTITRKIALSDYQEGGGSGLSTTDSLE
jgi:hypothetical protein